MIDSITISRSDLDYIYSLASSGAECSGIAIQEYIEELLEAHTVIKPVYVTRSYPQKKDIYMNTSEDKLNELPYPYGWDGIK